jgi:hypothetical protein
MIINVTQNVPQVPLIYLPPPILVRYAVFNAKPVLMIKILVQVAMMDPI